ncbi:hypothetical protein V5799_025195 [Amblyomma americanum]|uniref:Uncharacterized protein n=1 Tax=Amblyomma americanum TaxID=6943 RepID=A0AAQ4EAA1_AMBAM
MHNEAWDSGCLLSSWTTSLISMIPKPGKPPSLSNLRPISLPKCVVRAYAFSHLLLFFANLPTAPASLIARVLRTGVTASAPWISHQELLPESGLDASDVEARKAPAGAVMTVLWSLVTSED